MKRSIAKGLSEFCVWLEPAPRAEAVQGGEGGKDLCVFWTRHPCPEPSGMSGHAAWLILCLSSGPGAASTHEGGFGQGWGWEGSKMRGGGDGDNPGEAWQLWLRFS